MGIDWGHQPDQTYAVVIDASNGDVRVASATPPGGYKVTRHWAFALADEWHVDSVWIEANSIDGPNIEELQASGLPVIPVASTHSHMTFLIQSVMVAEERGEVVLHGWTRLQAALSACEFYERHGVVLYRMPYTASSGPLVALALAWYGARHSAFGISFV